MKLSRKKIKAQRRRLKAVKQRINGYAAQMRSDMTPSEKRLWEVLNQFPKPWRCKPQHRIHHRIADFAFTRQQVAIEVDGGYHFTPEQQAEDRKKDEELRRANYRVFRFTNQQVDTDLSRVVQVIKRAIGMPIPIEEQPMHWFDEMILEAAKKPPTK